MPGLRRASSSRVRTCVGRVCLFFAEMTASPLQVLTELFYFQLLSCAGSLRFLGVIGFANICSFGGCLLTCLLVFFEAQSLLIWMKLGLSFVSFLAFTLMSYLKPSAKPKVAKISSNVFF